MKQAYFYKDKPVFGLDIGHGSLKVMQLAGERSLNAPKKSAPRLSGYGSIAFDASALDDGTIVNPEKIASSLLELFEHHLIGDITTRRVALTIPAYRTYTRSVQLPKLKPKELREALELEVEQYVPIPKDTLYFDSTIIRSDEETDEYLVVAVQRKIVDSYLTLARVAGLEPVLIETTMGAAARLFSADKQSNIPTMIIDFGSMSADISIYDKSILVTGTVQGGGLVFTRVIQKALGTTEAEAALIKTKYGLGYSKKQKEITTALAPVLDQILKEIRRMMRYYEERYSGGQPIQQVVILGGGANMPGLIEYFTEALRLAVRAYDPWFYLDYAGLQPPTKADKSMYATVTGLALASPGEIFS